MFSGGIRKEYWSEMFLLFPSQCFLLILPETSDNQMISDVSRGIKKGRLGRKGCLSGIFIVDIFHTLF